MKTDRFEQLRSSVIEAGMILSGARKPSREFKHKVVTEPQPLQEMWAICIESDERSSLVPLKLYHVKYGENGVWVTDERGEIVVCDKEDFLPLDFAPNVEELLAQAA